MDIKTVRAKYPQYSDLSDEQLAEGLYKKYYSDLPRTDFYERVGFAQAPPVEGMELVKGVKTGIEQLKSIPTTMGLQADANAIQRSQQLLSAFDRMDRGEEISPSDTPLDITEFAQAEAYRRSSPEERAQIRQSQMGRIKEQALSVDEGLALYDRFQKETQQYAGSTPNLTDVDSAGAFADWLSFNVGSGATQIVPAVAAAIATRGRSVPFTMGASFGVQESIANRLEYIQDKTKDLPEDQKVAETVKYLQDTGTVSTLVGLGTGALDLFGPVGSALRRRVAEEIAKKTGKEVAEQGVRTGVTGALKDVPRDILEEGLTGAAQSLLQIGSERYLDEQAGDLFSGENIKRIINDAAAEAAGGLAGSGVNISTEAGKKAFVKRTKEIAQQKVTETEEAPEDLIRKATEGLVPASPDVAPDAPEAIVEPTAPQDQQILDDDVRAIRGLPPLQAPVAPDAPVDVVVEPEPISEPEPVAPPVIAPTPATPELDFDAPVAPPIVAPTPEAVVTPPTIGYRPQSEAERGLFGSAKVVDFGAGNAQINYDSDTIFLSRPDGFRGGPSDDAIIRPGDRRPNVIQKTDQFPDWVPNEARQPLIDYANIMAEQRKKFPNTPEGIQQLDAAMQNLPVTKRLNTVLEALSRPTAPVAPPSDTQTPQDVPAQPVFPEDVQGLPEDVVLQNRERSSPNSIQQMNTIANKPEYSKASFSNSFTDGAPVLFGAVPVPAAQLGRKGQIFSGKTDKKIPVRYAVIEATQAIPSNNVDGTSIAQYADRSVPGFRAITNGRLAGLQEGYRRNTMEQYKQDLMADDIHGIDPAVIGAMQNPLLVRIMPQNLVTRDIADISNTPSGLGFSAVERAKNDANRIDLAGLQFREDGGISPDTVRGFVASMPQTEQQELIDKQGRPTKQAYERLNAAIFSKAYQNDALIGLAAQAEDAEAKNIISALSQAAPQMAVLPQGDYDVRPAVLEATELAINARRQGQKLSDLISQQDLVSQDPVSRDIMQLFANNPRSAKKIGEGLKRIAEAANTEASKSLEPDMFGDVPVRRPLAEVVAEAVVEPQLEGELFAEPPAAPEVQISPEQEKAEALAAFKTVLGMVVPPHKTRFPDRTVTLRPKPLTEKQKNLLLELAAKAIDLGMPASVLGVVKRVGSTSSDSVASMANPVGWLTINKHWASQDKAEKLSTLIHEFAHAVDYAGTSSPTLSDTNTWTSAHEELKAWYKQNPTKHPLTYPFAPVFAKGVRIREESFAQAFALYFTSPKDLRSNAPDAYSQINDIVQGIQNESRPTQSASTPARSVARVNVQQGRPEKDSTVQPRSGEIVPSVSSTATSRDRADRVTPRESAQEDSQDIPLRDIVPPQTEEFKKWSRNAPLVTRRGALNYDFQTGKPFVAESVHGTNAEDFDAFDMEMGGLQTGAESAMLGVFSTSSTEVAGEYAKNVGMGRWMAAALVGSKEKSAALESLTKSGVIDKFSKDQDSLRKQAADLAVQINKRAEEIILERSPSILENLGEESKESIVRSVAMAWRKDDQKLKTLFQQRDEKTDAIDKLDQEYSGMMFDEMSRQLPQRIMPLYVRMQNPKVYDAKGKTPANFSLSDKISEAKKQGHDGVVFKNIADPSFIAVHYVSFNPQDIKSALGNRGTFDPNDPSIIRDVEPTYADTGEVRNVADRAALNADIREQKIVEYQGIKQRLSAIQRRRVEERAKDTDDAMERSLFRAAEVLKDDIAASKPTRSTPEDFMARASKALADGDISKDVYDVFDTMFKRNPALLDGIRLSVRQGEAGTAGQFLPAARIVRLFKGYGAYNPGTARHEVTHSMEQMMSPEARNKIVDKWASDLNKARQTNNSEQAQKFFDAVIKFTETPTKANYDNVMKSLPSYEYYQFVNPSEYWAVNAEKLMQSYLGSGWQRFKMSMKGFLEAVKKTLGLENSHPIYSTFNDLINKPRDRTTITMLTDYIGASAPMMNIEHRNFEGNPAPLPTWEMPPDATTPSVLGAINLTATRQKFQDKMIDLKTAQKEITKIATQIDDNLDAYTKESLFYGKTANQTLQFLRSEVGPVLQEMQTSKISPQELDAYLLAKHAPERNARIASINDKFPDGGSGIDTAQANAYIQTLSPDRVKQLESVNKKIRSIIETTQKIEVDAGLETQATIDKWNSTWKNYVPLFREEVDYVNGGSGLGRGFDVRGASSKRAVGSSRDIKSIFNSILEQRERAVVRAGKNEVTKAIYALAIENPNADFWLPINPDAIKDPAAAQAELMKLGLSPGDIDNIMSEPKVATVVRQKDPTTGQYYETVKYITSPNSTFSDNVISLRVNGKNRYVIFNPQNERAKRLAASLKNLDTEQLDFLTQRVGTVTRWVASMSTQYNPLFGLWNFTRDLQAGALNLSTTPLAGKQAELVADAFKFIPAMYKEYRAARDGKQTTGKVPDLLRKFLTAGAQTGYRDQFTKMEKHGSILDRELQRLNPGNVRKVVGAVGGWISDYNDVLENAIRLSAFNQALEMGLSEQKAASIAKELTVNFNRKGSKTPGLSALFAFFNAAVQGTARMALTLAGPAGAKIVGGGMLLGVIQALILEAAGFEEDEPTDFIKQKNLVIPTGNGSYVLWPMPLGFNFLPNLGRIATEMILGGKRKARDSVVEVLEVMSDSFNPLGGGGFLQTISPTVLDPFVAVLGTNTDAFGRPISRQDFSNNPQPGYLRSRQNATEFSKLFAEVLNSMSGGTEFAKGAISPTGDDIDYIIGQYLGGVGREAQKLYGLGKSQITGEELDTFRIPLFGKLYGTTESSAAIASRFYNATRRMAEHEAEIKGRVEKRQSPQQYLLDNPEARMYKITNTVEGQISKLNKSLRELQEKNPRDPRIESLKEQRTRIMRAFLAKVDAQRPN
jgi:hypothetical protein